MRVPSWEQVVIHSKPNCIDSRRASAKENDIEKRILGDEHIFAMMLVIRSRGGGSCDSGLGRYSASGMIDAVGR